MPLYEFDCQDCGARFEEVVPAGSSAPCPACGGDRTARTFSAISPPHLPVGLHGKAARESNPPRSEREAQRKDRLVAERKRKRGEGPPGG